jgi:hypothetical protein
MQASFSWQLPFELVEHTIMWESGVVMPLRSLMV